MAKSDTQLYPRFTGLKQSYPEVEIWISIGGWSMNDPDQPTAKTFSQLAASSSAQDAFFKSLLTFMGTYGFDGVDIDWRVLNSLTMAVFHANCASGSIPWLQNDLGPRMTS